MWGGSDLNTDLVPAWNVSYKGNVTFDATFADNFHLPVNQKFMRDKCEELKTVKGVSRRIDNDKKDITVNCWTNLFINEYLASKLITSTKKEDKAKLAEWAKE